MNRNPIVGLLDRARHHETQPQFRQPYSKRDYLLEMDIFRDLRPEQIEMIENQTIMRAIPKGRLIYSQEDRAEALFLLKRGRVSIYRLTPAGKRLDIGAVGPHTFFGEMPLLGESLRHAFAETDEESLLCVMSRADVERLIREQPSVALHMIEALGKRLAQSEARLEELAYRSAPARIAAALLRLSEGHDDGAATITHQELGDMIGALRETVTKILDEFQSDGLVELRRGRVLVRDVNNLRARLDSSS
ncbi:MAG TPA: Crp/Fnr family transcriptional regulator [Ktedonobacterales bacterium]